MSSTFENWGKLRLNKIMNAIGFEYPDYTKPVTSIEGREKRKGVRKQLGTSHRRNLPMMRQRMINLNMTKSHLWVRPCLQRRRELKFMRRRF